jgi:hypothetical protein
MKSSVGGFESPKGRFDVLFIDQVGSFDVAAIASCQEIGVCEYRRDQVGVLGIGFEVPKSVEYLYIARGVRTEAECGDQSVNRLVRVDGETGGLEKLREAFRGKFATPESS